MIRRFKIYSKENKEVILTYSTDIYYPYFLYSGFSSEKEAKQAVIDERMSEQSISNQDRCEAMEYVNRGSWIDYIKTLR